MIVTTPAENDPLLAELGTEAWDQIGCGTQSSKDKPGSTVGHDRSGDLHTWELGRCRSKLDIGPSNFNIDLGSDKREVQG